MAVRPDATTKGAAPLSAHAEDDLEQYGVWVKAEPQDIVEEPEALSLEASEFADQKTPEASREESFLTEDEEKLLGSFEDLGSQEELAKAPNDEGIENFDMKPMSMPDMEDLPPLEDFEIKDAETGDVEDLGSSTIDISLDDLDASIGAPSPISPNAPIDIANVRGLDSQDEQPSEVEPSSFDMEDVSAEFLDIDEVGASTGETADVTSEFLDVTPMEGEPKPVETSEPDFEPIDMELHFDDTLAEAPAQASSEPGFEEVSEFDDFLADNREKGNKPAEGFDDLAAVEEELAAPSMSANPPAPHASIPSASPADSSLSTELLQKIAEELSSIRGELVTLKDQIGSLKAEGIATADETIEEEPLAPPHPIGGFFDDEEDETIALTGDELDNILNTADFTEESAEPAETSLDFGGEDLSAELILPESGDYKATEEGPAIEEIRLEATADEAPLPHVDEEIPSIDLMVDEGVQPVTQAPEDTSYLEEPLPDEEALDLSEIPLHEESLLEAEPYTFSDDAEAMGLGDEEELPLVEAAASSPASPEALADMTLGMRATPDYFEDDVPEAQSVDALPEIEELSSFSEINLTEEGAEPIVEEVEEIGLMGEDFAPLSDESAQEKVLEDKIAEKTVKPAEPIGIHPDEIPMSLDDSFFVGKPEKPESVQEKAEPAPVAPSDIAIKESPQPIKASDNDKLKGEIKGVLSYLDKLLESLPEDKIEEFARSEYFDTYKKLFEELGLV